MKNYEIWLTGKEHKGLLKRYLFKIQAIIYCLLKGYIYDLGRFGLALREDISIKEVDNANL